MEEIKQEEQVIVLNDKQYKVSELSQTGKVCVSHINNLERKISEIQFQLDELNVSKAGFVEILRKDIDSAESKEDEK